MTSGISLRWAQTPWWRQVEDGVCSFPTTRTFHCLAAGGWSDPELPPCLMLTKVVCCCLPAEIPWVPPTMSSGVAHGYSISDLLRLLNEKLNSECTKIRKAPLHPPTSLEIEVSLSCRTLQYVPTLVICTDRKSRSQGPRRSAVYLLFAEHVTASQQATARDPFIYRSRLVCGCQRRDDDYSIDPRVPILARIYHLYPDKLDVDIHQE